jgi:hypothetical protein
MTEQEIHQVAMCAAHTYADMMVRMAIDQGETQSSDDFGRAVAEAYAAARGELIRSPGVVAHQPVMMSAEEYARFCKTNGSGG